MNPPERGRNDAAPAPHPLFVFCVLHDPSEPWLALECSSTVDYKTARCKRCISIRAALEPPARGCDGWGPGWHQSLTSLTRMGQEGEWWHPQNPQNPQLTACRAAALGKGDEWDGASPERWLSSWCLWQLQGQGRTSAGARDCRGQLLKRPKPPAMAKATCNGNS